MLTLRPLTCNVPVANDLAGLAAGNGKAEAVSDVIQAALQLLDQQFAGDALGTAGLLVVGAELAFEGEVDALGLLLLTQLQAVADDLGLAVLAVLAGRKVALLNGAIVGEAFGALQKELRAFATAKAADWVRYNVPISSPDFG